MQTLEERIRENEARHAELRKKIDALVNDPVYASRPELREAERNEFFDLFDEEIALYEQMNQLEEERRHDSAYDGCTPTLTREEELTFFRERAILTREDILELIQKIRTYYLSEREEYLPIEQLLKLLDRFTEEVSGLRIMDLTQDWWQYEITVRETDITLSLVEMEIEYDFGRTWAEKNRPILVPEQQFPLFTTKAKLLSPEEFGTIHGVSGSTVRQWIRRGKLRSVSKFGKEWRIPELTFVRTGEHYRIGSYSWSGELPDIPEEFEWLKGNTELSISSERGKKDRWAICLNDEAEPHTLDTKAKERLELYLLSEPLVQCDNNFLGDFFDKNLEIRAEEI